MSLFFLFWQTDYLSSFQGLTRCSSATKIKIKIQIKELKCTGRSDFWGYKGHRWGCTCLDVLVQTGGRFHPHMWRLYSSLCSFSDLRPCTWMPISQGFSFLMDWVFVIDRVRMPCALVMLNIDVCSNQRFSRWTPTVWTRQRCNSLIKMLNVYQVTMLKTFDLCWREGHRNTRW